MSSGITPHVQGLILVAHDKVSGSTSVGGISISADDSSTKPGIELSGAVDVPINKMWSATVGVGYWRIFTESVGTNGIRVVAGVVGTVGK